MRQFLTIFFLVIITTAHAQQRVVGTIINTPVARGYILSCPICLNCGTSPIVPVYTTNDSAFYFDEGTIAAVYRIDSFYCVVTKTNSDEYITYSNLLSTPYKKGDRLQYGAYVGRLGKSDDDAMLNQLDILVMTQRSPEEIEKLKEYGKRRRIDEHKSLMYDECVRYILRKMKAECSSNSATAL